MRHFVALTCALTLALGVGCDRERPKEPVAPAPVPAKASAPAAVATPEPSAVAPEAPPRDAGALPFDFPAAALDAKPEQFVLAPTQNAVEEAFEVGGERQTFVYYLAKVVSVGEVASRLKTLPGLTITVPNALILPLGAATTAKPGDVVLTAWASGSGMQRAIVVEGGTPEKPKVRYLDMSLDNPSGWGARDDTLAEGSFRVLTKPGEPGTTLACQDGARLLRWVVIRRAGEKVLGLGFAGRLKVVDAPACRALPLVPKVKVGDTVQVSVVGGFTEAKVVGIDAKVGRVRTKYRFGGGEKEEAVGFANVLVE